MIRSNLLARRNLARRRRSLRIGLMTHVSFSAAQPNRGNTDDSFDYPSVWNPRDLCDLEQAFKSKHNSRFKLKRKQAEIRSVFVEEK